MECKLLLDTLALVGGAAAFAWGLVQYRDAQRWKRLEFLASEIKEFDKDPKVLLAKQLLDWHARELPLLSPDTEGNYPTVTDDDMASALLRIPDQRTTSYSPLEVAIRDTLDAFFDHLDRFETYIQSGLFSYEAFHPYLRYWLRIIADPKSPKKSVDLRGQLREHVEFYFENSAALLKRFDEHEQQAGGKDAHQHPRPVA